MKHIRADFNAETADGRIVLASEASLASLRAAGAQPGDRVVLSDGDMCVEALLEVRQSPSVPGYAAGREVWVALVTPETWTQEEPSHPALETLDAVPLEELQLTA